MNEILAPIPKLIPRSRLWAATVTEVVLDCMANAQATDLACGIGRPLTLIMRDRDHKALKHVTYNHHKIPRQFLDEAQQAEADLMSELIGDDDFVPVDAEERFEHDYSIN